MYTTKELPTKSKRGRKPIDCDRYINEAEKKVIAWEAILYENRDVWTQKKYLNLYNKKTALQCRIRAKKELRSYY